MTTGSSLYRMLLRLYPPEFHQQFSEEMIVVFEQRAGERFANKGSVSFALLVSEFSSIVKGAHMMWLGKILSIDRKASASASAFVTTPSSNYEDATKQRDLAIRNMVTSISDHDFVSARRYSDEETRLTRVLEDLRRDTSATDRKIA